MPPAANTLSTRYAIKLLGNPATTVAKRAALEGEAIMTIAADHMLALPTHWQDPLIQASKQTSKTKSLLACL
jgi:hypothetical protein